MLLPYLEVDFHLMPQNTNHQPKLCPLLLRAPVQNEVAREAAEATTLTRLIPTPSHTEHAVAVFKVGGYGDIPQ